MDQQGKTLSMKTPSSLGMRRIDVLEYAQSYEYTHADVEAEHASEEKSTLNENVSLLMSKCFPHGDIPCGITITEYLQCVASTKREGKKEYKRLKRTLDERLQVAAFKPDSRLPFSTPRTPRRNSSPRKPLLHEIILTEDSMDNNGYENAREKPPPARVPHGLTTSVLEKNRRSPAATKSSVLDSLIKLNPDRKLVKKKVVPSLSSSKNPKDPGKNSFCEDSNSMGLDNPTPDPLDVLLRRQVVLAQEQEGRLRTGGNGLQGTSTCHLRIASRYHRLETVSSHVSKPTTVPSKLTIVGNPARPVENNPMARERPLPSSGYQSKPHGEIKKGTKGNSQEVVD
ncbi:hypothetical protein MTO96_029275 [Rhipicephalus appendiculatus]